MKSIAYKQVYVTVDADIFLESFNELVPQRVKSCLFIFPAKYLKLSKISCNLSASLTLLASPTKLSEKLSNAPENKLSSRLHPFRLVDSLLQA